MYNYHMQPNATQPNTDKTSDAYIDAQIKKAESAQTSMYQENKGEKVMREGIMAMSFVSMITSFFAMLTGLIRRN